ncbi:hypothetical protein [Aggregatibacter actinomycetemcomitans]|uniref:hypothetical protein n=1 Tax=Aggregatibacter actinomycetemcomitans TaxID=714 RepID=UPI00197C6D56|nr:hypothetical protein [Aggregatibacter actinomycetemcomitans]MBN6060411.1 hypothetical protein [Aggregatibacter actinomycetemcomitans]MBN6088963.1 hypothetical protein [Aggregatibacter actinomycetemcomitans]
MFASIAWAIVKIVAYAVASYYINRAFGKRGSNGPEAASTKDFNFPQIDEGTPQCVFFGDCWTEDWQVLAYGNYRTSEIKKG